ncbi:MAG: ParB/RepB/Spo0J family partition protein [Halanaerobiales bacterium]
MEVRVIPVNKIKVKRGQARKTFDQEKLDNLAESIQEVGQLQPVIVKKEGPDYLLIAGERRLRAIKRNNQKEISAVIMAGDIDNASLKQIQLIENIQRQNLNPLEKATAIQRLIDENGYTKKEASKKIGVPRTTLTEWLNILDVKEKYRREVIDDDSPLSLSHISLAKALSSRTGDPTKQDKLLDGVLKYHFSRDETKQVVDIIYKYLHISMEEAFNAVLLKREHQKITSKNNNIIETRNNEGKPVKLLVNSFTNLSNRIEGLLEKVDEIDEKSRKSLMDEFLYIYQMMEIMVPELKDDQLDRVIEIVKEI